MDNINVSLAINDKCCSKCKSSINDIQRTLTNYTDYISLQNGFTLKILSVSTNYVIISIDNGIIFFIRKLYVGISILICLPNECCNTHIIQIQANSI